MDKPIKKALQAQISPGLQMENYSVDKPIKKALQAQISPGLRDGKLQYDNFKYQMHMIKLADQ